MGSNPNSDYNTKVKFPTEYRMERVYPSYYDARRPEPQGIPPTLSYGGKSFDVTLTLDDLFGDVQNVQNTTAVVCRTGFSTHALNMGQRMVVLESSYTGNLDGTATLHVSQVPPNPAILPPGPALFFVVVNGVPSVAAQVMVGSGQIEVQQVQAVQPLPQAKIVNAADSRVSSSSKTAPTPSNGSGPGSPATNKQTTSSGVLSIPFSRSNFWLEALVPAVLASLIAFAS